MRTLAEHIRSKLEDIFEKAKVKMDYAIFNGGEHIYVYNGNSSEVKDNDHVFSGEHLNKVCDLTRKYHVDWSVGMDTDHNLFIRVSIPLIGDESNYEHKKWTYDMETSICDIH